MRAGACGARVACRSNQKSEDGAHAVPAVPAAKRPGQAMTVADWRRSAVGGPELLLTLGLQSLAGATDFHLVQQAASDIVST